MARPRKSKRICDMPNVTSFASKGGGKETVVLTLEEYETLRLLDGERLNQVECALRMEVSRPTVQILYARARRKIARFLAEGGELRISGGDYRVCENCGPHCNCGCKCGKSNNNDTSDK